MSIKEFFILLRLTFFPASAIFQQNVYVSLWSDAQISVHVPLTYLLYNLLKCQKYLLGIILMGKEGIIAKDPYWNKKKLESTLKDKKDLTSLFLRIELSRTRT